MEPKISGGAFVTWQGDDEAVFFVRLPAPFSNYLAESWGGLLIVTSRPDHSDPEILETDDLQSDLAQLTARIGDKQVFWRSEKNARDREKVKQILGKSPRYIG